MKKLLTFAVLALAGTATLNAGVVSFFGEDINLGGGSTTTSTLANSNAARTNFFANLTGVGTETFEAFATGASNPFVITFPGAGTATLTGGGSVIDTGNGGNGRFPISGSQYLVTDAGGDFTVTFSGPISAFGFFGTDVGDFGGNLVLNLTGTNGSTTLNIGNTVGAGGSTSGSALYYGFYDTTDTYTSISFSNNSATDVFGFDDFSVGVRSQVTETTPEPATFAMIGGGLGVLALLRRRKQ